MAEDLISVIVTAHNRKKFLPEALRSLEEQSLDKSRFEVIVVKNFYDKISDEIIERNNWKNIVTDEESLGGKIFLGLKYCKGSIVTFLEDDDLYRQDRLEKVYKAFKKHDIVFFYNDQEFIDEEGRVTKKTNTSIPKSMLVFHDMKKEVVTEMNYYHIGQNNSSLAIKTECIKRYAKLIMERKLILDILIYIISIRCHGAIFVSNEKLTLYRVHKASTGCWVLYYPSYRSWAKCIQKFLHMQSYDITKNAIQSIAILENYPNVYTLSFVNHVLLTNSFALRNGEDVYRVNVKDLIKHMIFSLRYYFLKFRINNTIRRRDTIFSTAFALTPFKIIMSFTFRYILQFAPKRIKLLYHFFIYHNRLKKALPD